MGVTSDRYGGQPGPVWGPGIGIINIGYIELGAYFCIFFIHFSVSLPALKALFDSIDKSQHGRPEGLMELEGFLAIE